MCACLWELAELKVQKLWTLIRKLVSLSTPEKRSHPHFDRENSTIVVKVFLSLPFSVTPFGVLET